jgi:2-polyprenyl-6-hydroxyphenyl methylase/3-demethylubiquinone-9 3-methyltransferase
MSILRNDLEIYDRHAQGWWDEQDTQFRSLRSVTEYRLDLLRAWLGDWEGLRIADLGCGGGLLSVPLAEAGARVFGVDLSAASLVAAREHAPERASFVQSDLCATPFDSGKMDVVLLADVLEHVFEREAAVREAARLLRPGGLLYVNTINRTRRARVFAVTLGEGLGFIPRGTHDPRMFVKPTELDTMAALHDLSRQKLQGEAPLLGETLRQRRIRLRPSRSTAVAYSALYRKAGADA